MGQITRKFVGCGLLIKIRYLENLHLLQSIAGFCAFSSSVCCIFRPSQGPTFLGVPQVTFRRIDFFSDTSWKSNPHFQTFFYSQTLLEQIFNPCENSPIDFQVLLITISRIFKAIVNKIFFYLFLIVLQNIENALNNPILLIFGFY